MFLLDLVEILNSAWWFKIARTKAPKIYEACEVITEVLHASRSSQKARVPRLDGKNV